MSRAERVEEPLPACEAFVNYSVDTGEKPASYGGINTFEADKKRTGKYQEYQVPIYDGRAIADNLSLEREGFILVRHDTRVKDFYEESEIRSVYYPEIEQLVKETAGAKRVLVFDHSSARQTARPAKRSRSAVRCAMRTMITLNGRDLNACATSCRTKPRNCSSTALLSSRCGVPFAIRCKENR
jgi:hypothetical protein